MQGKTTIKILTSRIAYLLSENTRLRTELARVLDSHAAATAENTRLLKILKICDVFVYPSSQIDGRPLTATRTGGESITTNASLHELFPHGGDGGDEFLPDSVEDTAS